MMERAALLCDREITLSGLNLDLAARGESSWKDIERVAIEEALRSNGGNRAKAAKQLGMSLRKLHYRLRDYGIRRQRPLD